jgi:hypothetical protein
MLAWGTIARSAGINGKIGEIERLHKLQIPEIACPIL